MVKSPEESERGASASHQSPVPGHFSHRHFSHRPKLAGMRRLALAFVNSWQGFKGAFRAEAAFRQEVALAVVLLPLGAWLGKTPLEKALLVSSVLLVLIVELLNTGIETVVDRIGLERHELSGLAKDVGSTAVLLSFVVLAVIWGFIVLG